MKLFFNFLLLIMTTNKAWSFSPKVFIITYKHTEASEQSALLVHKILQNRFNIPGALIENLLISGNCQKSNQSHSILEICVDDKGQEHILHLDQKSYQRSFRQLL